MRKLKPLSQETLNALACAESLKAKKANWNKKLKQFNEAKLRLDAEMAALQKAIGQEELKLNYLKMLIPENERPEFIRQDSAILVK